MNSLEEVLIFRLLHHTVLYNSIHPSEFWNNKEQRSTHAHASVSWYNDINPWLLLPCPSQESLATTSAKCAEDFVDFFAISWARGLFQGSFRYILPQKFMVWKSRLVDAPKRLWSVGGSSCCCQFGVARWTNRPPLLWSNSDCLVLMLPTTDVGLSHCKTDDGFEWEASKKCNVCRPGVGSKLPQL